MTRGALGEGRFGSGEKPGKIRPSGCWRGGGTIGKVSSVDTSRAKLGTKSPGARRDEQLYHGGESRAHFKGKDERDIDWKVVDQDVV
jgi:hypothetical protein